MRVTVLGCGGSHGVPLIGNRWGACDPDNPKNRRRRPSVFVEWNGVNILIDASPDLRAQLLDAGIERVDAVLFTHGHADHVHGIDDLRSVWRLNRTSIDAHAEPATLRAIVHRFGYLFDGAADEDAMYPPFLTPHAVDGPFAIRGCEAVPFAQEHGDIASTGFRLGRFAYSTDVTGLDEAALATLAGIDLWIVDCLRVEPHPTHAHLDLTLEWIARVQPRHAILTHMNHQADYDDLAARLPAGIEPAYDGMVVELEG